MTARTRVSIEDDVEKEHEQQQSMGTLIPAAAEVKLAAFLWLPAVGWLLPREGGSGAGQTFNEELVVGVMRS